MPSISHTDLIVEAFGLSQLPQAVQNSLLEEIDALVFRSVLFRAMVNMDEEDKDHLNDVLANAGDDFQKPFMFLKEKVKDFDQIMKEEVNKIRNESLLSTQSFA